MILLVNSVAMFFLSNLDSNSRVVSISSGLLMMVLFLFVLANLPGIYLSKTDFCIKLILPWIFFMWLTSARLFGSYYSFNNILRAVCFQSGSLLIFLCFFIQGKNCTDRNFKTNQRLFFILTLVTVFFFSYEVVVGKGHSADFVVVGHALYLTMLLPWISILNNKALKYILLVGLSCLALLSLKRSVLFQVSVGGFFYVLIQNVFVVQRRRLLVLLLTPFVLLVLFQILLSIDISTSGVLSERFQRIQEDRGSGRLDMWAGLWGQYKSWSRINQIGGKGFYAVANILGEHERSHNDFIEALLAYGAIGFLANVCFSIYLSVKAAGMVLRRHPHAASFAFAVISFWIISLVSYNLYFMVWNLYLLAFLGYICGIDQQETDIRTFYAESTETELYQLQEYTELPRLGEYQEIV